MTTSRKKFPIQKAADLIDWKPDVSLEEGVKRTTEWLDKEVYT